MQHLFYRIKRVDLDKHTEDAARLSARHQSANRLLDEAKALLKKRQADSDSAVNSLLFAEQGLEEAQDRLKQAISTRALTQEAMLKSEAKLLEIEENRITTQTKDSDARSELSEAEGETNALKAEVSALERVIARDSADGKQLIDSVSAKKGYEAALGAGISRRFKDANNRRFWSFRLVSNA